jgi:cytochrome P450
MKDESKCLEPGLAPELVLLGPFTLRGRLASALVRIAGWRVVARQSHVQEVLERPDVFSVEEYGERMRATTGEFFLGVDDRLRHARERDWAKNALDRALALTGPEAELDAWAEAARVEHTKDDRLDAHTGLCFPVLAKLTGVLFGMELAYADFEAIRITNKFIFDPRGPIEKDAREKGKELAGRLRAVVEREARVRPPQPRTVIQHLLWPDGAQQPADLADTVRTLAGLMSGATAVTTFVFHRVAERLIELPLDSRKLLQEYAHDERARFDAYVREAWRFVPGPPVVYRRVKRDFTLGATSACPFHVQEGDKVIAHLAGAQIDELAIDAPRCFRPERPPGDTMLFGHGQHYCIGDRLGFRMVSSLLHSLFTVDGKLPWTAGKVEEQKHGVSRHPVEFR